MKNLRKLIPAFAMLLVSAILMTTASYAWFSMNTQVAANGMTIKAKSDTKFLVIESTQAAIPDSTKNTWTTAQTAGEKKLLYPVTPVAVFTADNVSEIYEVESWKYTYSSDPSDHAKSATALWHTPTSLADYVATESFYIGLNSNSAEAGENLKVIEVDFYGTNTGMRVVVVCGENVYTYSSDANNLTNVLATSIASGASVKVDVYYYIDGEDTNVKTNNIEQLTGSCSLKFAIEE